MREKHKWTDREDTLLKRGLNEKQTYKDIKNNYLKHLDIHQIVGRSMRLGFRKTEPKRITNQKYTCNLDYFSKPNYINSFMAGWLAADGCIFIRNMHYKDLSWAMESADRKFLEILKEDIKYTGPIYERFNSGIKYINKKGENHSCLRINSIGRMADDLANNFNVVPNKTLRLGPPNLKSKELCLSYIHGFTNGDGCIAFNERRGPSIRFGSSGDGILEWVREFYLSLNIKTPRNRTPNIIKTSCKNAKLFIIGAVGAYYFYEILKRVPVPILERKWIRPEIDDWFKRKIEKHPKYFEESVDSVLTRNNIDFLKTF